ncbi:MAG: DUF3574 domain-containing protein [Pseudomonadota bacterium]
MLPKSTFFSLTSTIAAIVLTAGCAAPATPITPTVSGAMACPGDAQAMVSESLYFGTSKPKGVVTAEDWQVFLNEVVTPKFPQGLSVWRAAGQWKSDAGPVISEASYVLNIVHAGTSPDDQALSDVVSSYKVKFQQEAVLRVRSRVCASF